MPPRILVVALKSILKFPAMAIDVAFFSFFFVFIRKKVCATPLNIRSKRVMLIAPHQDDEALGCGMLLYDLIGKQNEIRIAFTTDGSACYAANKYRDITCIRQKEAMEVAEKVGISRVYFLDGKDSALAVSQELIDALAKILADYRPEVVFIPFFMDGLHDHAVTNELFFRAAENGRLDASCRIYVYEINSPIFYYKNVNYVGDTKMLMKKKKLLGCYRSQDRSLFDAILLLNRLHSLLVFPLLQFSAVEFVQEINPEKYKARYCDLKKDFPERFPFCPLYSIYFMAYAYFKSLRLKKVDIS